MNSFDVGLFRVSLYYISNLFARLKSSSVCISYGLLYMWEFINLLCMRHETTLILIQLKNILSLASMPGLYPINVQMSKSSIRKKLTAKKSIKIFYNILHKLPSIYILCEPCVLCVCQSACVQ